MSPSDDERVPEVVHEHRDVVAALRLEHALQPERLERRAHAGQELARVDGLREVRVGALLEPRLDRVRLAPRRREHDDRRARRRAARAGARSTSTPSIPGIDTSSSTSSGSRSSTIAQRLDAARRGAHAVAVVGEERLVEGERVGEVVDDEDVAAGVADGRERRSLIDGHLTAALVGCAGAVQRRRRRARRAGPRRRGATRGRTSVNVEPSPSRERTSISPPSARASRRDSASPTPVPS